MSNTKKYWKSLEDLENNPTFIKKNLNEFAEPIPFDALTNADKVDNNNTNRRDFLKYMGFSVTAASLAACETPVRNVIPYVNKPEEITPGISTYYASTYYDGNEFASILVKTREGRPIKIDANEMSGILGTSSRVQAAVLSLYDSTRLRFATKNGVETKWESVDKEIINKLSKSNNIRLVTNSIISPSTKNVISQFIAKYPNAKHISYDTISYGAIAAANGSSFGKNVIPNYNFEQANVIVSVGADFLATWLNPTVFQAAYAKNRKVDANNRKMSKHYQFEANLSLSGANADFRFQTKPSQYATTLVNLHNEITKLSGGSNLKSTATVNDKEIAKIAKELVDNKGKSIVICGLNDINAQTITNSINNLLANIGNTIDLTNTLNLFQGNDAAINELVTEMNAGKVDAIILHDINPAYSISNFETALKKVALKISTADRANETASLCDYIAPDHNFLEAWGDANPMAGLYALQQPTIQPLGKTRQFQDSLLTWAGITTNFYTLIQNTWQAAFPTNNGQMNFTSFWNKALHDGVIKTATTTATSISFIGVSSVSANAIANASKAGTWEIALYEKIGVGTGSLANNPWLQELPDPISKVCWDNYLTMSPEDMKKLALNTTIEQESKMSVVEIQVNGQTIKVPVFPSPGQTAGTVGLALGYGRTKAGKVGDNVGVNAYNLVKFENASYHYIATNITVGNEIDKAVVATTQTHQTLMGRHIIHETSLNEYVKDATAGNEKELFAYKNGNTETHKEAVEMDLWATPENPGHERPNHFWNMSIDLNSCIGCGSCVTACNVENNIAVVGKDEIRRGREMHWLRIDRYFSSEASLQKAESEGKGLIQGYLDMEVASANPSVVFQPVMCQHCNHAPCENVCPVLATTHSSEGLNQMTYNRCIGTRYCANNCPYKVRRFNWFRYTENNKFDYTMYGEVERMVLNPDVTVRTRGVIEKCSMCVQRIQEGKLTAKKEGKRPVDGAIKTACAQACPTNAIAFGDSNDSKSEVSKLKKDERMYHLLEELNVQPSVFYLTKVRNNDGSKFFDETEHEAHSEGHAAHTEEAKAETKTH